MQVDLSRWGPISVLVVVLVVVGATAGAIVVVTHPETLGFSSYLSTVSKFVVGLGVLGVGHGLIHAADRQPSTVVLNDTSDDGPGDPDALPALPVRKSSPKDQGDAGHAEMTS